MPCFCAGFAEGTQQDKPIEIQEATAAAFEAVLKYLYTDQLVFNDVDIIHVAKLAHQAAAHVVLP